MAEKVRITFLGTGSAVPTARRNHQAVLLQYKDENILFDCGEGTQRQFRHAKLNPCKLTRIFITHWHADHVLGLPGLLKTLALNNYNKILKIYGPEGTKKMMELYLALFVHKTKQFQIKVHEINDSTPVDEKEFRIEAEKMQHNCPTLAYSFFLKEKTRLDKKKLEKLKLPNSAILGELARGKKMKIKGKIIDGKKLIYRQKEKKITLILDTLYNRKAEQLAKNSDLLICESTYNEEGKELAREYLHLTAKQAAEIAKKSKSKKLILTHLSQRNEANPKIVLREAKKIFKNTEIAEDLMRVEI